MKIKTLVADDEPLARELLISLLGDDADIQVVGECGDGLSTIDFIERRQPDLAFVDIRMPGMNGIDIVEEIDCEEIPHIVFVTAYDEYAVKAFELEVVDYLLKPVERARLVSCLQRAKRIIAAGRPGFRRGSLPADIPPHLLLRKGSSRRMVPLADIVWIEAANQYVNIHTRTGTYMQSDSLGQFMRRIPSDRFVRVHRSAVVNCTHLVDVVREQNGSYLVVLSGGVRVPLARRNRKLVPYLWSLSPTDR